jgi:hypothetical protein
MIGRVLVRHQHCLWHFHAQADHGAVGRVLLHGLKRERGVEQVAFGSTMATTDWSAVVNTNGTCTFAAQTISNG